MASPAQVANDMAALAKFWDGRDRPIAMACSVSAHVIRAFLDGPKPDGRTVRGALDRLWRLERQFLGARGGEALQRSICRARETIMALRNEARQ